MEARPSTREGGTSLGWLCSVNKGKAFEEFGITLKPPSPKRTSGAVKPCPGEAVSLAT